MLDRVVAAVRQFLGLGPTGPAARRTAQRYTLAVFDDRSQASEAARRSGVAALVRSGTAHKWFICTCPCGCEQQIALNLMGSHSPRWRVHVKSAQSFSVHPSVISTTCGAHFWLRNGGVAWCD